MIFKRIAHALRYGRCRLVVHAFFVGSPNKKFVARARYAQKLWKLSSPAASARREATMRLKATLMLNGSNPDQVRRVDGKVIELRHPDAA